MKKFITLLLLFAFIATSAQEIAQWRGKDRSGIYHETNLKKSWPTDGPKLIWHINDLGKGHSSPVIYKNKLYITGMINSTSILFVYDLKGNLLWQKEIGKEWDVSYDGTRSTPTIKDNKLYITTAMGKVQCIDINSKKVIWEKNLFKDFDGKNIRWGYTESPLLVDNKLILTPGGEKYNIVALNKDTGETIWTSKAASEKTAYCSPLLFTHNSKKYIATSTQDNIICVDAETGILMWKHTQKNRYSIHPNTPIYKNGYLFSATGYRAGAVMLKISSEGNAVKEVWKLEKFDPQMGGLINLGNKIYGAGHGNRFGFCIDWNKGKIDYEDKALARGNMISAEGLIYFYSEKGNVMLVKPEADKFNIKGQFKVPYGSAQHWAHMIINNGKLYVRHGESLMVYDIRR